jgi:hypothetical protein
MVSGIGVIWAVTLFGPFMASEAGLDVPIRSPDQPEKLYSEPAMTETETLCPLSYQLVPEGLAVPLPAGFTAVVKLYWVVKLTVYVVLAEGAVIV